MIRVLLVDDDALVRSGLQRAQNQLVGVEGREHDNDGRVGLRGQ